MAHVQKFTKGNMQGLSIHLDRKTENHSNENIDTERTHLNYDLCEKDGDTLSRMDERLSEVYCMNRKDVKVCCEWIVTLPESLHNESVEYQRKFFEETYEFLTDRYGGQENVVSANVHNDETTPHMHFDFVPVVWDEKKEREKVSAKEVLTRSELKSFHTDLDRHLKERIPEIYQEGILNDKTIGIENIHSLKKYSAEIEQQKEEMANEFKSFKYPQKVLKSIEREVEKKTVGVFNKKEVVMLPAERYEKMKELSNSSIRIQQRFDKYKSKAVEEIKNLKVNVKNFEEDNEHLRYRNIDFGREITLLQKERDRQTENAIVYKSILEEKEPDLQISTLEFQGRLVLHNLENDRMPKNKEEGENWLEILEENKEEKTIPQNRLEKAIGKIKLFLEKFIKRAKEADFSMDWLVEKNKELSQQRQQQKKTKSRSSGMEL